MRGNLRGGLAILALLIGIGLDLAGSSDAAARQSMSFSPGQHSRGSGRARATPSPRHAAHGAHHVRARFGHARATRRLIAAPHARPTGGDDEGGVAKAVPGKGFTMENGILTYPAPARFQPKNLPAR